MWRVQNILSPSHNPKISASRLFTNLFWNHLFCIFFLLFWLHLLFLTPPLNSSLPLIGSISYHDILSIFQNPEKSLSRLLFLAIWHFLYMHSASSASSVISASSEYTGNLMCLVVRQVLWCSKNWHNSKNSQNLQYSQNLQKSQSSCYSEILQNLQNLHNL